MGSNPTLDMLKVDLMDEIIQKLDEKLIEMNLLASEEAQVTLNRDQLDKLWEAVTLFQSQNDSGQTFQSRFAIGDPVFVFGHPGWVRAVTFSQMKVRYFVFIDEWRTTIPHVDSKFVEPGVGEKMNFDEDYLSL